MISHKPKKIRTWYLFDVYTVDHGDITMAFTQHDNLKGSIPVVKKEDYLKLQEQAEMLAEALDRITINDACAEYDAEQAIKAYNKFKEEAGNL